MRVAILMVLDTSAVIAAITNEQDSSRFRAAMLGAESLLISSVAVLETKIVLFARGYNPDFDR
ncbi:MAG TPA: type II toxin-antitoxin system VapC family toxin [Bradyrhizobium sp.]|nr:type II toxin-antitoxin system VapC family toxin [Bradyrhizobium sp.]